MVALAEEQPFQLSVSYRGKQHQLSLPASSTLEGLGKALERETSAAFETIKLVIPGRKGPPARPATSPAQSLQAAGIPAKGRLMMLASSAAEVEAIQHSRDLPGLAGFDHEHKQAMRRRQHAGGGALVLPKGEYVFQQFRLLPHPALTPPPSEALKLLHRLAADPGIVGIMNKHRWTVGLLSEMPPEGKVGVSAMCILGYNVNQGQEISMRLRTDDLKGFRRYDRIRETLCHELAHMVWGEHDHNFKQLNSQLLRECAEFEAQAQGGHILAGPAFAGDSQANAAWVDEDDVMAVTAQSSGKTLRALAGSTAGTSTSARNPRAAAAEATLRRLARSQPAAAQPTVAGPSATAATSTQGRQAGVPSPFGPSSSHPFPRATSPPSPTGRQLNEADQARGQPASSSGVASPSSALAGADILETDAWLDATEPIEGLGHREDSTEAMEEAMRLLGDPSVPDAVTAGPPGQQSGPASGAEPAQLGPAQAQFMEINVAASAAAKPGPAGSAAQKGGPTSASSGVALPVASPPAVQPVSAGETFASPSPASHQPAEASASPPPASQQPAEASASEQPASQPGEAGAADVKAAATFATEQHDQAGRTPLDSQAASDPAAERYQKAEAALQQLRLQAGQDMGRALQTLATVLQNALKDPKEPKFRRVRQQNAAFQTKAGRFPAALDLLRLAGFYPDNSSSDPALVLQRNDPGLLWLTLSAVNAALAGSQS